jgi:hypothetical protein
MDLSEAKLPETVEVDGSSYCIHTSFKFWLKFMRKIGDKHCPPADFDFMYRGEKPRSRLNGLMALVKFCNPPQLLPRPEMFQGSGEKATDYDVDAEYIFAAFLELYGIDLVESNMHWYKFLALFKGLHGTKLNEIIGYRLYENTSGKRDAYTRQMEKLRRAWELPQTEDEHDEALEAFEAKLR